VWSPDAQHILMTENYKEGGSFVTGADANSYSLESWEVIGVSYDYLTYVMPANSALTRLPPATVSTTGVCPLFWNDQQGKSLPLQMNPMPRHDWTPSVQ